MSLVKTIKSWLPWIVVLIGVVSAYVLMYSVDDQAQTKKPLNKRVRVVQVEPLQKNTITPYWDSSGYVTAKNAIKVYARVTGYISAVNPKAVPGGRLKKDQWLAKLEQQDLALALSTKQAQLEQAQANLSLELADQMLAKEELALVTSRQSLEFDQALVLRKPQLTVAQAKVDVAQIEVDKAALNLTRSKILMPFDGQIINKSVGVGSKVLTNTSLFEIVDTGSYWLEVKIPYAFFHLLDKNKVAELSQTRLWGKGVTRAASIVSVLPELDSKDRQVKVLLEINQPIADDASEIDGQGSAINTPSIFINDFLNVRLLGTPLADTWVLKHHWLQPDNSIWVVDRNKTLQKRMTKVVFKGRDFIYVDADFQQGDMALAEKPGIASVNLPVKVKNKATRAGQKQTRTDSKIQSKQAVK